MTSNIRVEAKTILVTNAYFILHIHIAPMNIQLVKSEIIAFEIFVQSR